MTNLNKNRVPKTWASNIRRYLRDLSEKNLILEDSDSCLKSISSKYNVHPKPKTHVLGTRSVTTAATGTGRWFSCCRWCSIWYWSSRSFWWWWSPAPAHRYANLKFEFPANCCSSTAACCCSLMWCRPQPHALMTTTTSALAQWPVPAIWCFCLLSRLINAGLLHLFLYDGHFFGRFDDSDDETRWRQQSMLAEV